MLYILVTYKEVSKDMLYYWVQELGTLRSQQLGFNVYEPEKSKMKVPYVRSNNGLMVVLTCPLPVDEVILSQKRKNKAPKNKSKNKSTSTNLMTTFLRIFKNNTDTIYKLHVGTSLFSIWFVFRTNEEGIITSTPKTKLLLTFVV